MLIVIEGLDGAGKSTQVALVKEYIEKMGRKLKYLHFPRFDAPVYGELIAKFLRGEFGSNDAVHPQLVALLFAQDRADAAPLIREWLSQGCCVLLDRYVYSNIAYQCSKLKEKESAAGLREWIFNLEYGKFAIPVPDANIFLDVPISFVDSGSIGSWAKSSVQFISAMMDEETNTRVMGGIGDGKFGPNEPYTKEQSYLTMVRLLHAMEG